MQDFLLLLLWLPVFARSAPGRRSLESPSQLDDSNAAEGTPLVPPQPYRWLGWRGIARVAVDELMRPAPCPHHSRSPTATKSPSSSTRHHHMPHTTQTRPTDGADDSYDSDDDANLSTPPQPSSTHSTLCTTRCLPGTSSDCLTSCLPPGYPTPTSYSTSQTTPTSISTQPTRTPVPEPLPDDPWIDEAEAWRSVPPERQAVLTYPPDSSKGTPTTTLATSASTNVADRGGLGIPLAPRCRARW